MRLMNLAGTLGRHGVAAVVEAILLVAIVAMLAVGASVVGGRAPEALPALAAQPASAVWVTVGGTSSPLAAVSEIPFGAPFTVGFSTREKKPWALVLCYPNDTTIYERTFRDGDGHGGYIWGAYFSVYEGGPAPQNFILGDGYANWTAGGADCTVELLKFSADGRRSTLLASSSFRAVP